MAVEHCLPTAQFFPVQGREIAIVTGILGEDMVGEDWLEDMAGLGWMGFVGLGKTQPCGGWRLVWVWGEYRGVNELS